MSKFIKSVKRNMTNAKCPKPDFVGLPSIDILVNVPIVLNLKNTKWSLEDPIDAKIAEINKVISSVDRFRVEIKPGRKLTLRLTRWGLQIFETGLGRVFGNSHTVHLTFESLSAHEQAKNLPSLRLEVESLLKSGYLLREIDLRWGNRLPVYDYLHNVARGFRL